MSQIILPPTHVPYPCLCSILPRSAGIHFVGHAISDVDVRRDLFWCRSRLATEAEPMHLSVSEQKCYRFLWKTNVCSLSADRVTSEFMEVKGCRWRPCEPQMNPFNLHVHLEWCATVYFFGISASVWSSSIVLFLWQHKASLYLINVVVILTWCHCFQIGRSSHFSTKLVPKVSIFMNHTSRKHFPADKCVFIKTL